MNKKVEVKKEDGSVLSLYVSKPSAESIRKADIYRAKIWNECLDEGIKTKEELSIVMKKRGIWGDEEQKEEVEIVQKLGELERQLYLGVGKKKIPIDNGKKIAIQMRVLRNKLRDLLVQKNNFEQNTAENISDNARFDYLVSSCSFYENGQRVYKTIDEYNQKASDDVSFTLAGSLAEMMYSYDPNDENSLPENQWLSHFSLVNKDGSLVNDKEELVDLEGRKINEQGHYINSQGERVDIDGNPLDENGNYVIKADYVLPTKRKRKTTAKTTES